MACLKSNEINGFGGKEAMVRLEISDTPSHTVMTSTGASTKE